MLQAGRRREDSCVRVVDVFAQTSLFFQHLLKVRCNVANHLLGVRLQNTSRTAAALHRVNWWQSLLRGCQSMLIRFSFLFLIWFLRQTHLQRPFVYLGRLTAGVTLRNPIMHLIFCYTAYTRQTKTVFWRKWHVCTLWKSESNDQSSVINNNLRLYLLVASTVDSFTLLIWLNRGFFKWIVSLRWNLESCLNLHLLSQV